MATKYTIYTKLYKGEGYVAEHHLLTSHHALTLGQVLSKSNFAVLVEEKPVGEMGRYIAEFIEGKPVA